MDIQQLETPCLLLDRERTRDNIRRMQEICDAHDVALRPHMKTHKMVEVAKLQLEAGARGLTCAKISEAEAMLPSGVRDIFIAHSIVDPLKAPRLKRLAAQLDTLYLAVTSPGQAQVLERVLREADLSVPVLLALDSGLDREGVRTFEKGLECVSLIDASSHMDLLGIYTHEGHAYQSAPKTKETITREVWELLTQFRQQLDRPVEIWPGCSVTGALMAAEPDVDCVRPGAYVFGDHSHARRLNTMTTEQVSLFVVATVIDKVKPGLALIDAGSKVFSGDKAPDSGISGFDSAGRDIEVVKLSEEHGFLGGADVDSLEIGEKLLLIPAHVCPVLNLADSVVLRGDGMDGQSWSVDARGCSQ